MNKRPTFLTGNYRRLGAGQQIPIAPITIIVGNNSSGKSALLSAVNNIGFLYGSSSANIFDDNPNMYGHSFSNVCRGNDVERGLQLGFIDRHGFGFSLSLVKNSALGISPKEVSIYAQHEEIIRFEYGYVDEAVTEPLSGPEDEEPVRYTTSLHYLKCVPNVASIRRLFEDSDRPDQLDLGSLKERLNTLVLWKTGSNVDTEWFFDELGKSKLIRVGIQLMEGEFSIREPHFFSIWNHEDQVFYRIGEKAEYLGTRRGSWDHPGPMYLPEHVLPLIYKVCLDRLDIQVVRTLPELRIRPSAYVDPSYPYADEWYSGGGEYYKMLRQNPIVLSEVNCWLKDTDATMRSYEFRVVELIDKTQFHSGVNLSDAVSSTGAKSTDLSHSVEQRLKLWDDASGVYVGLDEVGTGISQVTPVLAMLYGSENSLLQIEQPELHLHPKLQARLADAMIDSTARGNSLMVETHSEHLILRLLGLVRSGKIIESLGRPLRPDDIQIIFVEGDGSHSQVIPIDVTPSGNLSRPWPNGFFDDTFLDIF